MLQALYDFFYNTVFNYDTMPLMEERITLMGATLQVDEYLSWLCSIISLIFIVVLCCLFIYRLIRLVGRLFHG